MHGLIIPPHLIVPTPDGAPGTRETLKHMRELVRAGLLDPWNRDFANLLVSNLPKKNWLAEVWAIFLFVRDGIRYSLDTNQVECLQSARATVTLGYGDCDDCCIALATYCENLGHACRFVALGFGPMGEFSHVIVQVSLAASSPWICLDATEPVPVGWFPPDATCAMICPI